ncbi:unnamed protein product [Dibothriocephalus latus]|uniref:Coiled-coil domain-containing protein 39 n=1 Tax=Dibothriocephalus latus TaxID=60516 RepID=A0A3P6TMP9_DIBLA|nr:unnamed protein product [Dibothriocephalus latus]
MSTKKHVCFCHQLTESRAKIQEVSSEGILYQDKNKKLRDHIELVKTERRQAEELRVELDKEIENQRHLIKLAEQENWRTGSDNRKLLQQKKKIVDRLGSLEDEIFLKSNQLTSIKAELDCDQKLVERYLEDCENDISLRKRIKSTVNSDSTHLQYLCSEEVRLSTIRMDLQKKLDTAVSKNEVISLRIDNACELSRIENRGRREMLQLWENTVAQMAARDEDYAELGKQYDGKLSELQSARAKLQDLEKLLASIVQDIADAKKKRHQLDKQAGELHDQIQKETEELTTTENDLLTLKKTVEKTSKDLQVAKAENRQIKEDLNRMKAQ